MSQADQQLTPEIAERLSEINESTIVLQKRREVTAVSWNSTGHRLATTSAESSSVRVFSIEQHGSVREGDWELRGHESFVHALCWDPSQSEVIATGAADKAIRIWDARANKSQVTVRMQDGEPIVIDYTHDGNVLAIVLRSTQNDFITTWDVRKRQVIKNVKFPFEVQDLCWGRALDGSDGSYLYAATGAGMVLIFQNSGLNNSNRSQLQTHVSRTYCVKLHPSNRYMATSGADAMVNVFDIENQICIATVPRLQDPTNSISFSHDGHFLAVGAEKKSIDISHTYTGTHLKKIVVPWTSLCAVAFHPRHLVLAACGQDDKEGDGIVRLFSFSQNSSRLAR